MPSEHARIISVGEMRGTPRLIVETGDVDLMPARRPRRRIIACDTGDERPSGKYLGTFKPHKSNNLRHLIDAGETEEPCSENAKTD
ncbi:MAG: hypothetical protein GY715_05840 [Planctomycetes bacterium]|nr:hypothetical protein [Planctomycetota bacterium]